MLGLGLVLDIGLGFIVWLFCWSSVWTTLKAKEFRCLGVGFRFEFRFMFMV